MNKLLEEFTLSGEGEKEVAADAGSCIVLEFIYSRSSDFPTRKNFGSKRSMYAIFD